jgi:hypothetical protein
VINPALCDDHRANCFDTLRLMTDPQLQPSVRGQSVPQTPDELDIAIRHFRSLPILDDRHPDQIIGYDEHGAPST